MRLSVCRHVACAVFVCMAILAETRPAAAQFRPTGPSVGDRYNVEIGFSFWNADPSLIVASESLGIEGDDVDLIDDLGIEQKRLMEIRAVLRPAPKHKFRIHYLPINYEASTRLRREFVFNGLRYRIDLPVNTTAKFSTFRFGYEYDFFYRERGYIGALVDLKYTNVDVTLDSPLGSEFTRQVAPLPTIGIVGRGYLSPNVSVTGEMTFLKIPENLSEDFGGRYRDYDFYGTVNFTPNVGAQFGRRSIDVEYFEDLDRGELNFTGWYFAGVVRF